MITIAVDAMGGDHAPRPEVEGSVLAAREYGVRVLLVGQPEQFARSWRKLAKPNRQIEIVEATEVITMEDHPAQAFRRKKNSSVHVAARLVKEGAADGFVSAGNTGAVMTDGEVHTGDAWNPSIALRWPLRFRTLRAAFRFCWMWEQMWIPGQSIYCNSA